MLFWRSALLSIEHLALPKYKFFMTWIGNDGDGVVSDDKGVDGSTIDKVVRPSVTGDTSFFSSLVI